jgi:hypothetical protein
MNCYLHENFVFLSIGRGAMNASCLRKFLEGHLSGVGILLSALAIAFVHNCQLVDKLALGNFKGLSQMGYRQILLKISAHLILMNTISNEPSRWTVPVNLLTKLTYFTGTAMLFSSCGLFLGIEPWTVSHRSDKRLIQ